MKFTLTIDLGNDAMRTKKHVAAALVKVSQKIHLDGEGKILDINGTSVGSWTFQK